MIYSRLPQVRMSSTPIWIRSIELSMVDEIVDTWNTSHPDKLSNFRIQRATDTLSNSFDMRDYVPSRIVSCDACHTSMQISIQKNIHDKSFVFLMNPIEINYLIGDKDFIVQILDHHEEWHLQCPKEFTCWRNASLSPTINNPYECRNCHRLINLTDTDLHKQSHCEFPHEILHDYLKEHPVLQHYKMKRIYERNDTFSHPIYSSI